LHSVDQGTQTDFIQQEEKHQEEEKILSSTTIEINIYPQIEELRQEEEQVLHNQSNTNISHPYSPLIRPSSWVILLTPVYEGIHRFFGERWSPNGLGFMDGYTIVD